MSALVFGATGLTGRHVVRELVRLGVPVVAHVRPDSPHADAWPERFGAGVQTDRSPWTDDAITALVQRVRPTLVFLLLGTTQARARKEGLGTGGAAYDAVDVRLTERVIDASVPLGRAARIVYLSSAGAGSGSGAYLAARRRVEQKLAASGLPFTIARPSFIVGDRDDPRRSEQLGAPLADGALALLGALGGRRIAARYRSITGAALAASLVRLAQDPAWADRVAEREAL
jgi:uncharacterized protein YbjT (DUF2867 family)